ncbi:hypothetical protein J437_LFUL010903 [Ladona fulva]|uniref:Uncharacterized protein n=1 Tax=Ladona fulva TaxID=123851 RepID=A0A8K0KBP7_LADFU|nr:hypothetical protein J437_LFUL010903 [Ladona fulva]
MTNHKSVFVTSNGAEPYDLRGPYDVMNLCLILGMNEEKAKEAISGVCRSLYIHSVGRRCGKAVVWVSKIPSGSDSSSMDEEMECSSTNNGKSTSESPSKRDKSKEESPYRDRNSSTKLEEKSLEFKSLKRPRSGTSDEGGSS